MKNEKFMGLYDLLEKPIAYNMAEYVLSLGQGDKCMKEGLTELITCKEDESVLDVGCGTGRYAGLFLGKYYGVDINEEYVKYAKREHRGNFYVMDAAKLSFSNEQFDHVFNVGVLHHLSNEDVEKVIDEMKRVCKRGGVVYIIDPVFPSKWNFIGYLLFAFDRGKYTRKLEELQILLSKKGFSLKQDIKGSVLSRVCVFECDKPVTNDQ